MPQPSHMELLDENKKLFSINQVPTIPRFLKTKNPKTTKLLKKGRKKKKKKLDVAISYLRNCAHCSEPVGLLWCRQGLAAKSSKDNIS